MLVGVTQTKIDYLEVLELVKQQILWFDVSMCNALLTQIFNACNQLLKYPACFLLFQFLLCSYEIKQLSIATMLHNQVKLRLSFNDFIKLNDVRVTNNLQNVNLSGDTLDIIHIFDFGLL